jgi:hypothetical protein
MGRVRRIATLALSVVSLLVFMVATPPAVQAARAIDVEISGPGMRSPVLIRWADLVRGAPPDVNWFDPATEPTGDLAPVFAMRIFNFVPTSPPTHLDVDLWSYYPSVGLIQTGEREGFYSRWVKPTASIRSVLDHAITGAIAEPGPGRGQGTFWGVLSMIIVLAVLLVMARRAWHRSPMVASGVDDA